MAVLRWWSPRWYILLHVDVLAADDLGCQFAIFKLAYGGISSPASSSVEQWPEIASWLESRFTDFEICRYAPRPIAKTMSISNRRLILPPRNAAYTASLRTLLEPL
ncbi:hypothetical protein ARMGADRAFT_633831 [Armillaria gallica]|uniref:Uncharacterized protein n=1 Tax=Armillaria gallica TaxID=47427 RepID=A0A2H3E7H6_ARMGA|nr:hypothetical protein ARMGADRAFT_633831 [Armillaria gallica]